MSDNYLKDERLYKVLHDRHYDGIGPVDTDEQIPMALRSVSLKTCSQTGHMQLCYSDCRQAEGLVQVHVQSNAQGRAQWLRW